MNGETLRKPDGSQHSTMPRPLSLKECARHVQQELGAALSAQKRIVPVVWDLDPSALPGWINRKQALDLRDTTWERAAERIVAIAESIKSDRAIGALVAGAILFGLFLAVTKGGR